MISMQQQVDTAAKVLFAVCYEDCFLAATCTKDANLNRCQSWLLQLLQVPMVALVVANVCHAADSHQSTIPQATKASCYCCCRDTDTGYMQDDTATFTAAFHVIKETCTFSRSLDRMGSKTRALKPKGVNTGENFQGKFVWKIEHFTRLKDILKKRKITGLCVKSKRFTVGGRDCRLIVYPRGVLQNVCAFTTDFRSSGIAATVASADNQSSS